MGTSRPVKLLDGATADVEGDWKPCDGGYYVVIAEGDFGGGTVTLQTAHDTGAGTPQDVYDSAGTLYGLSASANYASRIHLTSPVSIRATLAGATAPDLTIKLA